jgi:hypothetical protein
LEDRPARIKAEVLPYDKCDVVAALDVLTQKRFITRYTSGELNLIQINNFRKHQRITGKEAETPSKFPAQFPERVLAPVYTTDETPEDKQGNTGETPETTGREGKGKEGKGKDTQTPDGGDDEGLKDDPPKRTKHTHSFIPSQQSDLLAHRMLAINALKRRGAGTSWTAKEFAAFKAVGLHEIPDEDFEAQIVPLAAYYEASASALREFWRTTDDSADFRRRDVLTLLNNFAGEVDRATQWLRFVDEKNAKQAAGRL